MSNDDPHRIGTPRHRAQCARRTRTDAAQTANTILMLAVRRQSSHLRLTPLYHGILPCVSVGAVHYLLSVKSFVHRLLRTRKPGAAERMVRLWLKLRHEEPVWGKAGFRLPRTTTVRRASQLPPQLPKPGQQPKGHGKCATKQFCAVNTLPLPPITLFDPLLASRGNTRGHLPAAEALFPSR